MLILSIFNKLKAPLSPILVFARFKVFKVALISKLFDFGFWDKSGKNNCNYCEKVKDLLKNEKVIIVPCDNILDDPERKKIFCFGSTWYLIHKVNFYFYFFF